MSLSPIGPILGTAAPVFTGTPGSVIFIGPTNGLAQDNSNFFWDDTNKRLGIGTARPSYTLYVNGGIRSPGTNGVDDGTSQIYMTTSYGINYLESANSALTANAPLMITGLFGSLGSLLTLNFANVQVASGLEIFQTATLTPGSVGSLITPINPGAFTDALGGNLDGAVGVDTTNKLLWIRSGGVWCPAASRVFWGTFTIELNGGVNIFVGFTQGNLSPQEAQSQFALPAGLARKLRVHVASNTLMASTTVTFRKNGNNTGLTVTIGAGVTGAISDTSHSVAIAEDDLCDFNVITGVSANSIDINSIECYY
jgi:hypothetical protein